MKLTCDRSDLSNNLSLAIHAVPSRPTHPVLANVRLTADSDEQRIRLTAFDLSLGIRTSFPAAIDEGGEIAIPAKLLNDIVSRLPDGPISLANEPEATLTTLACLTGNYELRGMSSEEFPELPSIDDGKTVQIGVETLLEGLRGTLFSASNDETKQVLTGVHLSMGEGGLEFASTDGHRLAVVETLDDDAASNEALKEIAVTIPGNALRELERTIAKRDPEESVTLHFDDSQVVFEIEDHRVTSRKLDGTYPAYRQLLPKDFATEVSVDRRALLSTLERIAVIADRKNNIVKFSFDATAQNLALTVDAADVGSGKESLGVQLVGDGLAIAFNVRYVMESLRNLTTSEVQLKLNTPTSPAIVMPIGGTKMTHLVMPVQIRD
ncbi:MAG: DNA polymerase III subunit beta [Geitlerinemataceae cyanobacterium]